jgi:hypothetical protein
MDFFAVNPIARRIDANSPWPPATKVVPTLEVKSVTIEQLNDKSYLITTESVDKVNGNYDTDRRVTHNLPDLFDYLRGTLVP